MHVILVPSVLLAPSFCRGPTRLRLTSTALGPHVEAGLACEYLFTAVCQDLLKRTAASSCDEQPRMLKRYLCSASLISLELVPERKSLAFAIRVSSTQPLSSYHLVRNKRGSLLCMRYSIPLPRVRRLDWQAKKAKIVPCNKKKKQETHHIDPGSNEFFPLSQPGPGKRGQKERKEVGRARPAGSGSRDQEEQNPSSSS